MLYLHFNGTVRKLLAINNRRVLKKAVLLTIRYYAKSRRSSLLLLANCGKKPKEDTHSLSPRSSLSAVAKDNKKIVRSRMLQQQQKRAVV